ncbi:MAG: DUF3830 family protein [archaeon]
MVKRILIKLGSAKAIAELMEDEAPQTCMKIWDALPITGRTGHSMESGREVFVELKHDLGTEPENRTIYQIPGDVFTYHKPLLLPLTGSPRPVISYIYDRDSQIRGPHGPIPVNLFARIAEGFDRLVEESVRMRREGFKRAVIERA